MLNGNSEEGLKTIEAFVTTKCKKVFWKSVQQALDKRTSKDTSEVPKDCILHLTYICVKLVLARVGRLRNC